MQLLLLDATNHRWYGSINQCAYTYMCNHIYTVHTSYIYVSEKKPRLDQLIECRSVLSNFGRGIVYVTDSASPA